MAERATPNREDERPNRSIPGSDSAGRCNYKMRFGRDLKYHFEDAELRRRGGDPYEFDGTEKWGSITEEDERMESKRAGFNGDTRLR